MAEDVADDLGLGVGVVEQIAPLRLGRRFGSAKSARSVRSLPTDPGRRVNAHHLTTVSRSAGVFCRKAYDLGAANPFKLQRPQRSSLPRGATGPAR